MIGKLEQEHWTHEYEIFIAKNAPMVSPRLWVIYYNEPPDFWMDHYLDNEADYGSS